jgi:hypothetical protein
MALSIAAQGEEQMIRRASWLGMVLSALCVQPSLDAAAADAQAKWIWHSAVPGAAPARGGKPVEACFRRAVVVPDGARVATAMLAVTADASECRVYVNGVLAGDKRSDWRSVLGVKLAKHLHAGQNTIAVVAAKGGGWAGLVGRITIGLESGPALEIVTDREWKASARPLANWASPDLDDMEWAAAAELGALGMAPWGALVLEPSPQPVGWPAAPTTRPLTGQQADALVKADWLQQAANNPTLARVRDEIESARRIAQRLASHPSGPSFAAELGELGALETKARGIVQEWKSEAEVAGLYLSARATKRRIMFRNPAIDFQRLLLIDGSPPAGHESGHRNTYGGDLRRIGGNRIVVLDRLSPDADARDLIPAGSGGVMRMDLAFDASRLVFGMVPKGEHSFHLYEVELTREGVAAGPVRQLTNSPYHDMDPIYLPDGRIAFCTTRGNTYVRCLPNSPCTVLARCDADGRNIRMISNNNEPEYTPCLLPDGRILYTRWEYTERPLWRLQALWTMNPDGTNVAHYWGNRSSHPDMLWEGRPVPETSKVMFTGVGHHDVGGGPIGIVDVQEGRDFPQGLYKVTAETAWTEVGDPRENNRTYSPNYRGCSQFGRFASPYPLSSHDFLVSAAGRRETGSSAYWLYLMDVDGNRELVYAGTGQGGVWCAMPLRSRTPPRAIPDRVRWPRPGEKAQHGVFYSANVLEGVDGLPRGKAKYVRVLQQDHKTYSMGFKSFRHSGPIISALQEDAVKRILGTVPVEADGSVSFRVPAGRAVYFQLLDENQRCLQIMRSFTGVMPGETRGCVGCHEAHGRTMPAPAAMSRAYEGAELTPPPWGADVSISYERFAQPVLDKYCGKCHQGEGKGRSVLDLTLRDGLPEKGITDPKLLPFKEPYLTLIGDTAWSIRGKTPRGKGWGLAGALPVEAGGYRGDPYGPIQPMSSLSYTSPLIQLATSGKHNNVRIQGEDVLRLIAWVDANCVYRGEEEVRQIPDPDESVFAKSSWTVPPRTRTAPVIDRLQAVCDPAPRAKAP